MRLNDLVIVLGMSLSLSAAGCLATADDPAADGPLGVDRAAGHATGMNGLKSVDYWANVDQYVINLSSVSSDAAGKLYPAFASANLSTKSQAAFYEYAFLMTSPITLTDPWANPWPALGNDPKGYDAKSPWPAAAIPAAQVPQVLAILTAFMNNNTTHIPIALSGASITLKDDISKYDLKEALIIVKQVTIRGQPALEPHVWLDDALAPYCNVDVYKAQRFCEGKADPDCAFHFHNKVDDPCVAAPEGMVCDGVPAIQTLLMTEFIGTQDGC